MNSVRNLFVLVALTCMNAPASLLLTINDPSQTAAPGAHAVFHGSLLNTDAVAYSVLSFVLLNTPTDSMTPPTGNQLFPIAEPAVPFNIAVGGTFTGVVVDITVPTSAQTRDHPFVIEAATNLHGPDGQTIVSNSVLADLSVATPEASTGILVCFALAAFWLGRSRNTLASRR